MVLKLFNRFVAVLLVLFIGGCTSLVFKEPTVSLSDVVVERFDFSGVNVRVDLDAYNPNGYDLQIQKVEYSFSINGMSLSSGNLVRSLNLSASSTTRVSVPISLSLLQSLNVAKSLLSDADHRYAFSASVYLKNLPIPITINKTDKIDLNKR